MRINSKSDYHYFLRQDIKALNLVPNLKNKLTHDIWKFQKTLRLLEYYLNCKKGYLSKLITVYLR